MAERDRQLYGKRILLAEDNELNQEIAVEILGDAGFTTEVAENGQAAVDMLSQSQPSYYQLILMDVQMPVMNGYEATSNIRRLQRGDAQSVWIVAMTANAFAEDAIESQKAGMNEHISKPLDLKCLMECMGRWLT